MKDLCIDKKSIWLEHKELKQEIFDFCEGYKKFINISRTEREFTKNTVIAAVEKGFMPLDTKASLKAGDKVYALNRGKNVMLAVIGKEDIEKGINLVAAHIDSPRLDIKPSPLFEEGEMAFLKTHYYGGIRKYQWVSTPLAMHGTVILKNGASVDISIGDEGDDLTFTINDLLPHLAVEQSKKNLREAFDAENFHILVGSIPVCEDDVKEPVKMAVLQHLNDKYGIIEEDFLSAEIEMVPAFNAKDVGFDRGMIGGAGQDDRVCGYTALKAIFEAEAPEKTAVCLLIDKEEIGSMGNTGARSHFFEDTLAEICARMKDNYSDLVLRRCLAASKCLSADVCTAFDPNYASVSDKKNSAFAGYGVAVVKYTGSGGKGGASDASAELVAHVRKLFNENQVSWQMGELGKVDVGGGGTISQFIANLNVDTIDCGTPVLAMHSPFEVTSKADVYMTYKAYKVFFK